MGLVAENWHSKKLARRILTEAYLISGNRIFANLKICTEQQSLERLKITFVKEILAF